MPNLWYVRKAGGVEGPFPAGALVQDRLLGRLDPNDLVSSDRENWQPFDAWPQLKAALQALENLPATDPQPGWNVERAKARARWADQRAGTERRSQPAGGAVVDSHNQRHGEGDRRGTSAAHASRQSRPRPLLGRDRSLLKLLIGLLLLAAVTGLMLWLFGPVNPIRVRVF